MAVMLTTPNTLLGVFAPKSQTTRLLTNLATVIVGTLLLTLAAKTNVPTWPVPVTLQGFAVAVLAAAFGWRIGVATVVAYLLEGADGQLVGRLLCARGDDDFDQWVADARFLRQLESVHRAGHVDIGKQDVDLIMGVEDRHRLAGVVGRERQISIVFDNLHRCAFEKAVVIDDKNCRRIMQMGGHVEILSAGSARAQLHHNAPATVKMR